MLCHCGLEAAALLKFVLMWIGSAVSLLADGHNATVCCLWPQNKAPLTESDFWPECDHFCERAPGCVSHLASSHVGADKVGT